MNLLRIPLFLSLILLPFIGFSENLLDIQSVKIAKGYNAEFLFDLEADDNFTVSHTILDGSGNHDDLRIYLLDLNQLEEEVLHKFENRSDYIRIPSTGLYKLVFEYAGGGGLSWRRSKYLNISVKVSSIETEELQSGESRQILRVANLPLDTDPDNPFRIIYELSKGDKLYFSSGDNKAPFVKLNILQLGIGKFINSLNTVEIPKDGYYTFDFYFEDNSEATGIYQTLSSLLSSDDINLSDLNITREKDMSASNTFTQQAGSIYDNSSENNSDGSGGENGEDEEEEDPMATYKALMEQMSNSNSSAEENQQAMIELMAAQAKIMEEASKKREYVEISTLAKPVISMTIDPTTNFAENVGVTPANRKCEPLNLKGAGLYNIWFYYIAVGEKAEEAFEKEKERYASYSRNNIIQKKAEYVYYSNSGDQAKAGTNPPLPKASDPEYREYFNEDVEYAVVDYYNSQRFLLGENYSKLNSSRHKYVTTDEGISFIPTSPDVEYFICMCNNNKSTAIKVFFTYFTISATTNSY